MITYTAKEFDGLGRKLVIEMNENSVYLRAETSEGSCGWPFEKKDLSYEYILDLITKYTKDAEIMIKHSLLTIARIIEKDPTQVIVNGVEYTVCDENDSSYSRGFAGRKFKIKFSDGREVVTTNLWSRGEVPPLFREICQDNAVFI